MSISVDVCLLSGNRVSLEVEPDASVESLGQRARRALATGKGRLLNSSGEALRATSTIEESKLQSGDVLTLHVRQIQLVPTRREGRFSAFAALLSDGSVISWGKLGFRGDSSLVQQPLMDVQQIEASQGAFAAILEDGSVVSWGSCRLWWRQQCGAGAAQECEADPIFIACIRCDPV